MPDYEQMYYEMIKAVERAIEALEQINVGEAKRLLIEGECAAEEIYIDS